MITQTYTAIKPQQRESNIELLRLVIMAMIVLHHFIFHGLGVYRSIRFGELPILNEFDTRMALFADSFLIYGVNVFILISGYFSIKLKAKSFVRLFAMCSFFAMLGWGVYVVTNNIPIGGGILLRFFKRGLFVISSKTWWFIQLYFILMFLSVPINKYIANASKKSHLYTIGVFLFINVYLGWIHGIEYVKDGYNLYNFIMLYLIGRYLKLYWNNNYKVFIDLSIFLLCSFITVLLTIVSYIKGWDVFHALQYNSPFVIIGAIALLLLFSKMNFTSKMVNYLAASCLAIYLFQEGVFNFYRYIQMMYVNGVGPVRFIVTIVVFFILSMLVPIVIDKLRVLLFGCLEEKAAKLVDEKLLRRYL